MKYAISIPALIAFVVVAALGPTMLKYLHKLKFGQYIREEGPASHQKKSGTPTMGGILFLIGLLLGAIFFVIDCPEMIPVLLVTFGYAAIGFVDDYIKIVKKHNEGLTVIQKFGLQILVAAAFSVYMIWFSDVGTSVIIPFCGGATIDLGWAYFPLCMFVMVGTVNGSNFTDGLDGLASSVTIVIAAFMAVVSISAESGVHPVASAMVGCLLGFLIYNTYPAKVFMGDTGSLALGGFVAGAACMLKIPFFLPLVAFIYFAEVLSVIIQVVHFKRTGNRVFRMAPIHHHFELGGWPETKVVAMFTIVTTVLCLIGFLAY